MLPRDSRPASALDCSDTTDCQIDEDAGAGPSACSTNVTAVLPLQDRCETIALQAAAATSPLALDAVQWSNLNLSFASQTELTLTLNAPSLDGVFVQLSGPVVLRITAAHSLHDLRIAGSASADGRPRLELEDVEAEVVSIGDEAHGFEGTVSAHATKFVDLTVKADDLTLESVWLENGSIACETLNLTDGTLKNLTLDANTAVVSASSVGQAHLHFCDSVSLIECQLEQSTVTTCAGTTARMYTTSLIEGAIDGSFEADGAHFAGVRIGAEAATDLIGFNSTFSSVDLCSQVSSFAIGMRSTIDCSECDPSFQTMNPACALPDPPASTSPNFCVAWPDTTPWQACPDGLPERTRPRL
jgi:hypothetical protein